jgi:hypothetical protein
MFETIGNVTEVCKSSQLDDQVTIEVTIPCSVRGKVDIRFLNWVVPIGTLEVGMTVKLAFIE